MTTVLPNQPQQATAGQSRPQQATATYPRPPGTIAAAAAAKRRHTSSRYPYEIHAALSAEAGLSLQRLSQRRGLRLRETDHIRHAIDVYLNAQDPIFARWLSGEGDGRK
jgi:hypothetical protein